MSLSIFIFFLIFVFIGSHDSIVLFSSKQTGSGNIWLKSQQTGTYRSPSCLKTTITLFHSPVKGLWASNSGLWC